MKFIVLFILFILSSCYSPDQKIISLEEQLSKIPVEDQQKLETLFHHMMTGDYFACTLFGNKPMTFQEFHDDPWKLSSHCMACPLYHFYMEEGWKTWVKYRALFPSKNFIFAKIPSKGGYEFIILINRGVFEKMFDANRDIFQQALGSQITAEKIFHDYEEGQVTFGEVLNDHEGLVGLVLGYGREASLCAYRDESVTTQILRKSLHPLSPSNVHDKLPNEVRLGLTLRAHRLCRKGTLWHQLPCFHVEDAEDPYEELKKNQQMGSFFHPPLQELIVDILPPNFFCIKNAEETDTLKKEYGHAMHVARESFKTKSFLRGFLEQYLK
ncbi:MAG: hypothetical protein KR126chlam2_00456 [Chlamydiae bacterium]|nr:hypothetical protein [Chlamydiota bacterium]